MPIDKDLLGRGLAALGLEAEGQLAASLARYGEEIELWNPAYGLVGAEGDELVIKHLLDSLAPLSAIQDLLSGIAAARAPEAAEGPLAAALAPPPLRLADLGTGAGLPGIPLALALPGLRVTLVERMGKRVRFLENERSVLGLSNVVIQEREVERAEGRFEIITFRAFRPFERKLFKKVFALCETDGFVVAYKGKRDKAGAELPEIEGLYATAEILPLKVPFLEDERCLVVMTPRRPPGDAAST
jgi:16S rRNA (guanine527-N7)-methyltransferase